MTQKLFAKLPDLGLVYDLDNDSYEFSFVPKHAENFLEKAFKRGAWISKNKLGKRISEKYCAVCDETNYDKLTVDHIVPIDFWGEQRHKDNLMFLCECCNNEKDNMLPNEWIDFLIQKNKISSEKAIFLRKKVNSAILLHISKMMNFEIPSSGAGVVLS